MQTRPNDVNSCQTKSHCAGLKEDISSPLQSDSMLSTSLIDCCLLDHVETISLIETAARSLLS